MSSSIQNLPKAELHSHIEGTVTPNMARRLAQRYNVTFPDDLFDEKGEYRWVDFLTFVTKTFDTVAATIRTAQDYYEVTFDYLKRLSEENAIYSEIFICPSLMEHLNGLPADEMLAGLTQAIDDAREKFGIETRMITTLVRHLDTELAAKEIRYFEKNPHKYVTGVNIAGAEKEDDIFEYQKIFEMAHNIGLEVTAHAGEACGPQAIRNLFKAVPFVKRIGHGVRAIDDMNLIGEIIEKKIVLEVNPTSNLCLGIYPDYKSHPLKKLMDLGVRVTISSDDPTFFGTSLGREYEMAHREIGLSAGELLQTTRTSIEAAFIDEATRAKLLTKLNNYIVE